MWAGVHRQNMATDGEVDTSRKTVKTYVPAYQKEEWQRHAEDLDMSQSEFVRTMVQAGRRGFLDEPESTSEDQSEETDDGQSDAAGGTQASGTPLETRVESVLSTDDHMAWDELLGALTDDIEARLEDALADLQDENVVRYSGRNGGYTLVEQ